MVFQVGKDSNRHMLGRKPDPVKQKREETEKSKLRKLRLHLNKHIVKAIETAAGLMETAVKEETKLRAAIFITEQYIKVHGAVISEEITKLGDKAGDGVDNQDDDDKNDGAAVFSMSLVENK